MDLKSRGRQGRSFMHRAVRRVTRDDSRPHISGSNIEDAELTKKVEALFSQELLFERLHTEPKWKRTYDASVKGVKHAAVYVHKQKLTTKAIAVAVLVCGIGGATLANRLRHPESKTGKPTVTSVAGVSDGQSTVSTSKLPAEVPDFQLLQPQSKKNDPIDTVRVSPTGNDPVYAFQDTVSGVDILVSEQEVPSTFDYNKDVELERVAKEFQATDVIQIDSMKVYHGVNEKSKVQSLVFIKDGLLIFIKSPTKLTDDQWLGYILSLEKY